MLEEEESTGEVPRAGGEGTGGVVALQGWQRGGTAGQGHDPEPAEEGMRSTVGRGWAWHGKWEGQGR